MHQTIGRLSEAIDGLKQTVQNQMTMWANQEKNASEGRRILHDKVEDLKDTVTDVVNRVASVETKLTEIKPEVQEFKNQREQQKGAMKLGKVLWTAMLAGSGTMGAAIGWGVHQLFVSPPPGH
jgi:chromosome segregation ATPase